MNEIQYCALCQLSLVDKQLQVLVDGVFLCSPCCEMAANAFVKARTGRWFSYPEPPRLKKVKEKIPASLRTQVFERDAYRCVVCASWDSLRADHIVAESKGGKATLDNLQTLCLHCNSVKGAR